jgi:hypothetical protein
VLAACPYHEPRQYHPWPPSHFLNIHLTIIFPSTPGSSKWYFSFSYHHQTLYTPLYSPLNATRPTHLIHDLFTRTILGSNTDNLGFSLHSFFRSPATSFLLGPNILRSKLFSNTRRLRPSFWTTNFHTHTKQQAKS